MKAVRVTSPASLDTLRLVDEAEPHPPGPGEIQVRLRATSLNFHDLAVVTGRGTPDGRIPMSDGAGNVVAVGDGVTEFKVGDPVTSVFFPDWRDGEVIDAGFSRVPGDGIDGYARESVTRPAHFFTHAPAGYTHAEAATLTCAGLTAWRALVVNGRLKAGDHVLVLGTGGVSIFALQLAKAMGATVIATSSSDEKLERLKALGADHVINYRAEPRWGRLARKLTGGSGVDHVVEVGGAETLAESLSAAKAGGHVAIIGVLSGPPGGGSGGMPAVIGKQLRLTGLIVGSRRHQLDLIRAIDTLGLKPVLDRRFALANLAEAFRHQQRGGHLGKITVDI